MAVSTEGGDRGEAREPEGKAQQDSSELSPHPGCATSILAGVIVFLFSLLVIGMMWLVGLDVRNNFYLTLGVFVVLGALMNRVAYRLKAYFNKREMERRAEEEEYEDGEERKP